MDFEPIIDNCHGTAGIKCTHADGRVIYIFLNPSAADEPNDEPNVFVYVGESMDPGQAGPECYIPVCEPDFPTQPR